MFDTIIHRGASKPADVHVNLTQPPADAADAARLHGEMVDRARKEVASAVVQYFGANNDVRVVRCETEHQFLNNERNTRVMFNLNGVEYDFEVQHHGDHLRAAETRKKVEWIIANEIASQCVRLLERKL